MVMSLFKIYFFKNPPTTTNSESILLHFFLNTAGHFGDKISLILNDVINQSHWIGIILLVKSTVKSKFWHIQQQNLSTIKQHKPKFWHNQQHFLSFYKTFLLSQILCYIQQHLSTETLCFNMKLKLYITYI